MRQTHQPLRSSLALCIIMAVKVVLWRRKELPAVASHSDSPAAPLRPVKILAVSDEVAPQIYDAGIRSRFPDVELVLSCGDVPHYYLEYIVGMLNVPLLYVMGNHGYELETSEGPGPGKPPEGCVNIHGRVVRYQGLSIAGLEGSMRYKNGPYQYTQSEMEALSLRLALQLLPNRLKTGNWLDILLTHAPPLGVHDGTDQCHTGFRAFLRLMRRCRPRYLIHGHTHVYSRLQVQTTLYGTTTVINAFPYRVLDIPTATTRAEGASHG